MPKRITVHEERIVLAALRLLDKHALNEISLDLIAQEAGIPLKNVVLNLSQPFGIWEAIDNWVHAQVLRQLSPASTIQDTLFEAIMLRFETMARHKSAFLNLNQASRTSPPLAYTVYKTQKKNFYGLLEQLNLRSTPFCVHILWLAYLAVFIVWERESSNSWDNTMARLNELLGALHPQQMFSRP